MDIKLNYIDDSNDPSNSQIVIFQKNVATDFDEIAVAWKVIKNCGHLCNHPFTFPMEMKVSASDSWGNYTSQLIANNGQLFSVKMAHSGDELAYSGQATSTKEVQVRNDLGKGAISANIYKDGKLLAAKTAIAPGQKAVFEFKPTIFIGVVSQVVEGEVMNSAVISSINTELSLLGISSADIVMRGGGPGQESSSYNFTLENVVMG